MEYTTVDRVKDRIKAAQGTTAFDTVLLSLVRSVSNFVDDYCGRKFEYKQASDSDTTKGWKQVLTNGIYVGARLENTPVESVSHVHTIDRLTEVETAHPDFYVSENKNVIFQGQITATPPNEIEITYTGGYKIDFNHFDDETKHTLPAAITDVCETLIAKKFQRRDSEGQIRSEFDTSIIEWDLVFGEDEKEVLSPYIIYTAPM